MPVVNGMSGGFGFVGFYVCGFLRGEPCPTEKFCKSVLVMNISIQQSSRQLGLFIVN